MADEAGGWVIDPKNPNRATYTDEDGEVHETFKQGYTPPADSASTTPSASAAPQATAPTSTPIISSRIADPTTEEGLLSPTRLARGASRIYEGATGGDGGRNGWRRLADSFEEAGQHGFPGWVARKWYDWTDAMQPELRQRFPGKSNDWYEQQSDKIISEAQRGLREDAYRRQAADPNWRPDETFWQAASHIDRWGPWLTGQVLGSAGPETLVGGPAGKGAAAAAGRVATQVGMGSLSDAAYQVADIKDKVADEFSVLQNLGAAAAAGGFQSVFEVPGFIRGLFKGRGSDTTPGGPEARPGYDAETGEFHTPDHDLMDPTERTQSNAEAKDLFDKGASFDAMNEWAQKNGMSPFGDDLKAAIIARDAKVAPEQGEFDLRQPEEEPELPLEQPSETRQGTISEEDVPSAAPEAVAPEEAPVGRTKADLAREAGLTDEAPKVAAPAEPIKTPAPTKEVKRVRSVVDETIKDWKNAPEFEVIHSFDDIADPEIRAGIKEQGGDDASWMGFVGPDGIVRINAKAAANPAAVKSLIFHEALGHHGLSEKFQDGLDDLLENIYNTNPSIREKADAYGKKYPDTYANADRQTARHVDEVLAEMSQDGRITPTIRGKIVRYLNEIGRKMGLKLKYSDGEIRTILGMAHDATINGTSVLKNGFRLSRPMEAWHGSANDFDKFDHSRVGEGEKNQHFGWGTYVSESKGVAEFYRDRAAGEGKGKLYNVDLPDSSKWVDLDKNFSDQSPEVKAAFKKALPSEWYDNVVSSDMTGKEAYAELANYLGGSNKVGDPSVYLAGLSEKSKKAASEALAKEGIAGNRYPVGAGRTPSNGKSNYVVFDDKTPSIISKAMRRTTTDEDAQTLIGSINPSRIQSKHDIEEILEGLAAEAPEHQVISHEQTMAEAKAMGMSTSRMLKGEADVGRLDAKVTAARQFMTSQLNKFAKLQEKLDNEGYSEATQADYIRALTTLRLAHATVSRNATELGRAQSSLRMMSDGKMNATKIVKAMQDSGNELLGDPKQFMKFAKTLSATQAVNGPLAAIKMARQAFKPNAEKYIFSAWYNMLLSSPATHVANFVGTGGNFLADLAFSSGAAVKGQFGRNADRIRGREVAYRVWGALSALRASADTWANTRKVINGRDSAGAKAEGSQHVLGGNKALDFASGILEGPSRALAGADEFWRNVLQLSNIHGLAVRNAGNEGLKGKAFWSRVGDLIQNPTDEMLANSADYAKVLQFQDKASAIGKAIIDLQTPKADSTVPGRVARSVLKVAVPFVRTPDALIRTALRYTPLGAFERENIKGWKAGGAERDKVKARLIMGSAISFWLATQAYKGNITGQGPSDTQKRQEWLATHQENSIKVGDKYYSIAGLEPVSTVINGIATLTERAKNGEIGQGDAAKQALSLAQGIGSVLTENSYMEGLNSLLNINDKDTNKAEASFTNFIAGLASSATTPAILRKYTQSGDPAVRDTTGDGSVYDRVAGRIMSALPGLSEQLPQRYDVYGRAQERVVAGPDLASRTNVKSEEDDPTIKELMRLATRTDKVIVGAPGKNVKVDGEQRRLTAKEFQRYQHLSGYWVVKSVEEEMKTPEWQTGDDAYRIDTVKEISEDMRKAAREYLFDPDDDEDNDTGDDEE